MKELRFSGQLKPCTLGSNVYAVTQHPPKALNECCCPGNQCWGISTDILSTFSRPQCPLSIRSCCCCCVAERLLQASRCGGEASVPAPPIAPPCFRLFPGRKRGLHEVLCTHCFGHSILHVHVAGQLRQELPHLARLIVEDCLERVEQE